MSSDNEAGYIAIMRINDYQMNRLRLLKAIRRTPHVTRTDLVKLTGLAAGSITQLTADLVRRGIVQEEKAREKALGRPRVRLGINPTAAYAVGVFPLPRHGAAVEIVNLCGDIVFIQEQQLRKSHSLKDWISQLTHCIDKAIRVSPVARQTIARIAVSIPGIVDSLRGVVHWMATFPERDVPMAALMQERLGIPVSIDNSTDLLARAEHWFGERCLDDFSLILVDQSVTSAHYVDGSLWTGSHGINPELAHTKPGFGDEQSCYCGMRGCLATYCAMFGIVARVAQLRSEKIPINRDVMRAYRRFAAQAREGESRAAHVFAQAGHLLGVTVANLLNERDPGNVIVIASDANLIALTSKAFFAALEAGSLPVIRERTHVQFRLFNPDQSRKGAAALALEQIYMSGTRETMSRAKPSNRRRPGKDPKRLALRHAGEFVARRIVAPSTSPKA